MEKKSKKSIIIGVTTLLLVALTLIGLTYAYYRTRVIGNPNNESISVTSKLFEVTYTDGDANFELDSKVEPSNETVYTKTFTVTNTGSETASYSIVIDNMTNTFERNQDWEYTLTTGSETLASGYLAVGTHQILVASRELTKATNAETYTLSLKYINSEEDQSEDMGQTLKFRINISDETYTWENPGTGTLLAAIKANNTVGEPSTIPGQEPSASDEKVLAATEDDYGTSYYFRGNVENNYVTYSGMCWRIVRVQGDGTIKLALADENHPCGADVEANDDGTYSGYSTQNGLSAFVDGRTNIAYKASPDWAESDFVYETSDIPGILDTWAKKEAERTQEDGSVETVANLDTSKLASTEWCNDASVSSIDVYNYYGAYGRLGKRNTAEPSLKCNFAGLDDTKAIRYTNNIGILSADEIAFAGSTYFTNGLSYNYYLKTNATGNFYWTLSPYNFLDEDYPDVLYVHSSGYLNSDDVVVQVGSVRPAVVLASDVLATTNADTTNYGLPGTQTNPYVIS